MAALLPCAGCGTLAWQSPQCRSSTKAGLHGGRGVGRHCYYARFVDAPVPVLLVTGPPASGKTFGAGVLADRLGLPLIEKDAIKETLFDYLGTGDGRWSQRLGRATFALIYWAVDSSEGTPTGHRGGQLRGRRCTSRVPRARRALSAQAAGVSLHSRRGRVAARYAARAGAPSRAPRHAEKARNRVRGLCRALPPRTPRQ